MDQRVQIGGLSVAASLHRFVEEEALPGSGVQPQTFWEGVDAIVHDLAPRNRELLARRDELQSTIDAWHRDHPGPPDDVDNGAYSAFLREIGYLLDEPAEVTVTTAKSAALAALAPSTGTSGVQRVSTGSVTELWNSLATA